MCIFIVVELLVYAYKLNVAYISYGAINAIPLVVPFLVGSIVGNCQFDNMILPFLYVHLHKVDIAVVAANGWNVLKLSLFLV